VKTCHMAERKMSSWGRTKLVPDEGRGAGGKRIPGLAVRLGEADGEQLEPDTHIWQSRARGEAAVTTVPPAAARRAWGCCSAP